MNVIKIFVRKSCWTINKIVPLHVSLFRYILSFVNDKSMYPLKESKGVFDEIYETNFWESTESKSGRGSTMEATVDIREALPLIFSKYSITSMLDVPCSDFNWMRTVDKSNLIYRGGDIVPDVINKNRELYSSDTVIFSCIDITKDLLPKVDLIFCRDCLQHLSDENVIKAIGNFKKSGSIYLLTTSYPMTWRNYDILDGDYRSINLSKSPFNFPKPIMSIKETKNVGNQVDKILSLYRIKDLPVLDF
ncbi:MAG: class I SAM-dependent methyltransferase [Parabacteroides sp.]|nr:class I SAM-dependent methyltransferase [Parabacteroides sp.]